MRKISIGGACLAVAIGLSGCGVPGSSPGITTVATDACSVVAKAEADPAVAGVLNALPPTSAGGILWADLKAGCKKGAAPNWLALVLAELQALFPNLI